MLNTWKGRMNRTATTLAIVVLLLIGALVWILSMYPKAPSEQVRVGPVTVASTTPVVKAEEPGLLKKLEIRLAQLEGNSKPLACDKPAPPPRRHLRVKRPVFKKAIIARTPPPVVVAQLPRDGADCFANGHRGIVKVVGGKINCVWEEVVVAKPAPVPMVAQLETSKVGTPCPGDGYRSATYQIINGQLACLLDGVTQAPIRFARQYRQEPEVVYVDRVEYQAPQQGQVAESSGSSWLPWGIAAGALAWGLSRHNTSTPAAVAAGLPAVTTNPVGLGVVTGPAW